MNTKTFRPLTTSEVRQLESFGNRAEDWNHVQVSEAFDAALVRNNVFMGAVAIGDLQSGRLHDGDLHLPEGIYNSFIADSTIGGHCAIHNVRMLSGYRVGDHCLLFNIDEMTASPLREDNDYPWIEPMNECGGRRILP